MIIRGRRRDTEYTLSLKVDSLSVAINVDTVIVYDLAGRFYSIYQDNFHYRRSLSGQILQKWSGADGRQRRWLEQPEADALIDFAADQLQQLRVALSTPDWKWLTPPDHPSQVHEFDAVIERGARFDSVAARLDAARFADVYSPIGILPPDQYLALVLQATEGCSFNTCTFCDLYHQAFRVKPLDEFREHIRQVRAYLGESILLRQRSIFLGAANALAMPMARLVPMLEIIREECHCEEHTPPSAPPRCGYGVSGVEQSETESKETRRRQAAHVRQVENEIASHPSTSQQKDVAPLRTLATPAPTGRCGVTTPGVYAFLDAFTGTRKSVEDYRALAGLGLKRVYIGLESGHDPLLQFVKKPGEAQDAIETVRAIKAAGINVGVIVLIGLGGDRFVDGHTRDTLSVLNQMELGHGDLIYFSDLVEEPNTPYPQLAAQQDIRALNASERAAQRAAIRSGLNLNGAKVSNYDVREFVY